MKGPEAAVASGAPGPGPAVSVAVEGTPQSRRQRCRASHATRSCQRTRMTATQDASDTTSETASGASVAPTTHQGILDFVNEVAAMTKPARIHWCTGSDEEWTELTDALVSTG